MHQLKPFLDWAKSVLEAAEGGKPYIASSTMSFQTGTEPKWGTDGPRGIFTHDLFEPGDDGLHTIVSKTVQSEMDAQLKEADHFADHTVRLIRELEQYEHWVKTPLTDAEMIGMHQSLHDALFQLADENELQDDVERWRDDSKILADKVLLAVAYVLSWQPYGVTMQFVWGLAKPWYVRLSETIAEQLDNEDMDALWPSLNCLRNRVLHFDSLLYGFLEGAGAFDNDEDVDISKSDLDAIKMFSPSKKED